MIYDVNSPLFRSFLSQKGGASDKRYISTRIWSSLGFDFFSIYVAQNWFPPDLLLVSCCLECIMILWFYKCIMILWFCGFVYKITTNFTNPKIRRLIVMLMFFFVHWLLLYLEWSNIARLIDFAINYANSSFLWYLHIYRILNFPLIEWVRTVSLCTKCKLFFFPCIFLFN